MSKMRKRDADIFISDEEIFDDACSSAIIDKEM
jgi:hypothetical protein